jgi:hypothetical protein
MPENARTFYQTLDGQVEQNKIYTKLAIPEGKLWESFVAARTART